MRNVVVDQHASFTQSDDDKDTDSLIIKNGFKVAGKRKGVDGSPAQKRKKVKGQTGSIKGSEKTKSRKRTLDKDTNEKQPEFTSPKACDPSLKSGAENLMQRITEENVFIENVINSLPLNVFFNSETLDQLKDVKQPKLDGLGERRKKSSNVTMESKRSLNLVRHSTITQLIKELEKASKSKHNKRDIKKSTNASMIELNARLTARIAELQGKRHKNASKKPRQQNTKNGTKSRKKPSVKPNKTSVPPAPKDPPPTPVSNPIYNKEGKMVFSKFDFSESGSVEKKSGEYSGKDFKKLLKKVNKEQEKILKLEEKDEAKAELVKTKKKWKAALERAEGIKVKDDPLLLKKGMKRIQQKKKKSKKEWTKRLETVKQKQIMKQKKRSENIQARKKEKATKKKKRAIKKGRLIPGFT